MKLKIKKLASTILLSLTLVMSSPLYVLAEAPSAPSAPTASEAPEASEAPQASQAPQASPAPASPTPTTESSTNSDPAPSPSPSPETNENTSSVSATNSNNGSDSTNNSSTSQENNTQVDSANTAEVGNNVNLGAVTGENDASYNTGAASSITTGNSLASAIIETTVNNVTVAFSGGDCCAGGSSATNSGNGSGSNNTANSSTKNNTTVNITNSADILNKIIGESISGKNDASYNTGGDSEIITGDADVVATIITDANAVNMGIYQFDILTDQNGDIILTQDPLNCINCGQGTSAINENNGSDSTNNATANSTNNTTETSTNDGDVVNNIDLKAISGKNDAKYNTNGDSTITTGDSNVIANVVNALNTVVDGVIYTVNVFGDLVGNIILPDQQTQSSADCGCCAQDVTAANSGNGSGSTNTADSSSTNTANTTQTNNATIDNNLDLNANTGYNDVNFNTDGNSVVETGDVSVDANVINVANVNVSGGPCDKPVYMVFVNDPNGNWQGQIAGAAPGTYFYTSDGLLYVVDDNGDLITVNSGNGSDSTNTAAASQTNTTNVTQNNSATLTNNINIQANSGDNQANFNTGGENTIKTGDANILLNVVNFVNSNFSGRKVVMTVVNVIGSWIGHFVPPGFSAPAASAQGGTGESNNSSSQGGASSNNSNSGTGGSTSQASTQTASANNYSLAGAFFSSGFAGQVLGFRTEKIIDEDNSIALEPQTLTGQTNQKNNSSFNFKILLLAIPSVLLILFLRRRFASTPS